jgi:hypothetical protein
MDPITSYDRDFHFMFSPTQSYSPYLLSKSSVDSNPPKKASTKKSNASKASKEQIITSSKELGSKKTMQRRSKKTKISDFSTFARHPVLLPIPSDEPFHDPGKVVAMLDLVKQNDAMKAAINEAKALRDKEEAESDKIFATLNNLMKFTNQ